MEKSLSHLSGSTTYYTFHPTRPWETQKKHNTYHKPFVPALFTSIGPLEGPEGPEPAAGPHGLLEVAGESFITG